MMTRHHCATSGLLIALPLMLGIGVALWVTATAQTSSVKMTIQVLDPQTADAQRLPKATEFHEGHPVVSLDRAATDTSVQVLADSLIILHGNRSVTYTIDHPDVLAVPPGIYHFPKGVRGIFQATKPGTAILTVVDADQAPECPTGIDCTPNWSGYILPRVSQPYTGITGQWTVPAIASNSPQGASSSWVGIGGNGTNSLIQAGTAQFSGEEYNPFAGIDYYAWYEIFPAPEVIIPNKPVSPGDVIKLLITPSPGAPTPVDGTMGEWSIQVTNVTQHWFYSATETYGGDLRSAEWIEEAPGNVFGQTKIADYQQVEFNFYDQVAIGGGPLAPVQFTANEQVWLNQGGASGLFSTPSNPSGDGKGFYVTWTTTAANQVFPPGPWIQTTSLPPAQVNQPYSETLLVNQASSPSWTLVSGSLPPGLTLDQAQGTISGTVSSQLGTFPFSVFATDLSNGSYTATQPLSIQVFPAPFSSLQVNCIEFGPSAPPAINVVVDNVAQPCGMAVDLGAGVHTVVGSPVGRGPFKVTYSGSCNSVGQVMLTLGNAATCVVTAETATGFENACPAQQHCCEPSETGCLKCISGKLSCP